MKNSKGLRILSVSAIAAGLLLLPGTLAATAQTESQEGPVLDTTPFQETSNDLNNWGWLGLLGLVGLANFFRSPERVEVDERTVSTYTHSNSTHPEYRERV